MASPQIHIDIWRLLQARLGRKGKLIPHFAVLPFEKLVHQDELNGLLAALYPRRGEDFCRGVLDELDIKVSVGNPDNLPADGRAIFVCNHPLGGVDGMSVIAFLNSYYGCRIGVVVNDLLTAIEPLSDIFLPVNKFGGQHRECVHAMEEALEGDDPILFFPAGLVSRMRRDGSIHDLEWKKSFITKAIQYHRPLVPLYFDGRNTDFFYRAGYWRRRLRMRTNFEQLLLPREVFLSRGSSYRIIVGKPVPWQSLRGGTHAGAEAVDLCNRVYCLAGVQPAKTIPLIWK